MYIKITYKFHRIPDTQSHFITKVHDLLGHPSYIVTETIRKSESVSEILLILLNLYSYSVRDIRQCQFI